MTLFPTKPDADKPPPKRHKYSPGFLKVYNAFGKMIGKRQASESFHKKALEGYADHIAHKAFVYRMYCKRINRMQKDLSTWINNDCWEDELFEDAIRYDSPALAFSEFKLGKWTHCDGIDCTKLEKRLRWNEQFLILGDQKLIPKDKIRDSVFQLRFGV